MQYDPFNRWSLGGWWDLGFIGVALLVMAWGAVKKSGVLHRGDKGEKPIISSYQMLNASRLTSMHKGTMEGFTFNLLTNDHGRVMALVDLGHNTKMHLIAIGDKSNVDAMIQAQIANHYLERTILEGDFPTYFRIYVSPGKQVEVRQVMEPRNMAQFVDFCRAYNVEIFKQSLYISVANDANDMSDNTTMTEDLNVFLRENGDMLKRL